MPSVSKLNEVKQVQDDVIVSDERQTKTMNENTSERREHE